MPKDLNSALAFLAVAEYKREAELDEDLDLLAAPEEEICPTCGSLLVEYEEDSFLLECPICDRRMR